MVESIKINKYIKKLSPYKITSQDPWLIEDKKNVFKLDWNEGAFIPNIVKKRIKSLSKKYYLYNWYSDYSSFDLHAILAKYLDISINNVLSFPGSDNALESICRCFLDPRDKVVIPVPTYDNFEVFAESCGAKLIKYKIEKPYKFNLSKLLNFSLKYKPKIIYLATPNNPCGYFINPKDISIICKKFPKTLIICDQAYVEFAKYSDCKHLINKFHNIMIVRTFSKAFSLAGIRLGYVIANNNLLKVLSKIRNGKNISMMSQILGISVIENINKYDKWINSVNLLRNSTYNQLLKLKLTAYKSHGNFILFEINSSKFFLSYLKENYVYLRDKVKSTDGGIRLTITDKKSVKKFIELITNYIAKEENKFYF